jgi:hypothetical protein
MALLATNAIVSDAAEGARSVGAGQGTLVETSRDNPCGYPRMHGDTEYENAYSWNLWYPQEAPYYTSFAEYFTGGTPEVCAVILDLTRPGNYPPLPVHLIVWDDQGGMPGNVIALTQNVDVSPISIWPEVSRHVLPLASPCYPQYSWWVGFCLVGTEYQYPANYVAADLSEDAPAGRPYTNIPPGWGYPEGWQSVEVVWGETTALGIGILAHTMLPSATPEPRGMVTSWGKVKELTRGR